MVQVITGLFIEAPMPIPVGADDMCKVFMAGSIEMNTAENWQDRVLRDMVEMRHVLFMNPRRSNWDPSWEQKATNPQFKEQVEWELDMLDDSDIIIFYFDINTKSPITLLELGLHAGSGHCIVCCPKAFWREGNIDILCSRYDIPLFDNYEDWITHIKHDLDEYNTIDGASISHYAS